MSGICVFTKQCLELYSSIEPILQIYKNNVLRTLTDSETFLIRLQSIWASQKELERRKNFSLKDSISSEFERSVHCNRFFFSV